MREVLRDLPRERRADQAHDRAEFRDGDQQRPVRYGEYTTPMSFQYNDIIDRTLAFPVDRQFRYAVGAQYALGQNITLGTDFTLIDAGSAPVNQVGGPLRGTVVGSYAPNLLYAIGLNLVWRF
jgi:hypothetical protein